MDPSLRWNTLHPGIQAATLVGRTAGSTLFCSICREPDHTAGQCALSYLQPPTGTFNAPGLSIWPPGPRPPLRRCPESMTNMHVLEQRSLHVPGHVSVQACLRYMPAAPYGERLCGNPCSLGVQTCGWWQEPSLASRPETPLLMWQASGAYARYLIVLHIMLTFYLYPCVHNIVWMAIYILTRTFICYYICAFCCCLVHVVFLFTNYVHMVTLRSLLW